jgi:hypothetical protein
MIWNSEMFVLKFSPTIFGLAVPILPQKALKSIQTPNLVLLPMFENIP